MIDNVKGFIDEIFNTEVIDMTPYSRNKGSGFLKKYNIELNKDSKGEVYCPHCHSNRRVDVNNLFIYPTMEGFINSIKSTTVHELDIQDIISKKLVNSLWNLVCRQCGLNFTTVFYANENDVKMTVLPSKNGGLSTGNTPRAISYYLDEASKAKSIGANSACIAMYRTVLEQILYNQGYNKGMLGNKIANLEKDIKEQSGPNWIKDIDPLLLKCIKDLGNGAIHANDGDIDKQKYFDSKLIEVVDLVFSKIIDLVYEQPIRENEWRKLLSEKAEEF